jgi:hypothetical protein
LQARRSATWMLQMRMSWRNLRKNESVFFLLDVTANKSENKFVSVCPVVNLRAYSMWSAASNGHSARSP